MQALPETNDNHEPRNRVLSARLPQQIYTHLEEEAARRGVGLAECLRAALYDRYCDQVRS